MVGMYICTIDLNDYFEEKTRTKQKENYPHN